MDASGTSFGVEAVDGGQPIGLPSVRGVTEDLVAALHPGRSAARATAGLAAEWTRIAVGRSGVAPAKGDWRFKDPAWQAHPGYRRLAQGYLAWCAAIDQVSDDLERSGGRLRAERARFLLNILTSAAAPTNSLLGNPAAMKRTFETGGASLLRGLKHVVEDVRHNGAMPATARPGALRVGVDLALTPGAVVDRDEYAEVLQYAPSTESVYVRPTLIVPPPIGRYYFLDLRPGRSFVEYATSRGLQTFLLSWRNPSPADAHWDIDTYAQRILDAVDAVRDVTDSPDVNVIGFCAGGILQTAVLNKLAAFGDGRVHAAAYAVTLLDFGAAAPISAFSSPRLLALARWNSRRGGVITAKAMGNVFTWMRPNDLIWNYWVNDYLMGEDPPVFDILSWNADGTNLPAALHEQFLDIFEHNPLPTAGALRALDESIDLSSIKVPTYVVGAVNDHLTPWRGTYRTTELLSGDCTFALSNAGHIASLVNPPGNPKASYFTGPHAQSAEEWLAGAELHTGSWWEHWADWSADRSGERKPAPERVGSLRFPAIAAAPGVYVHESR